MQLHSEGWKPVAYCLRRLSEAETRYAQIEKECLASIWTCERFGKYYNTRTRGVQADHRSQTISPANELQRPGYCPQPLPETPDAADEVQSYSGVCTREKPHHGSALSRSPVGDAQDGGDTNVDVECYVASIINNMPATERRMDSIRAATVVDDIQAVT